MSVRQDIARTGGGVGGWTTPCVQTLYVNTSTVPSPHRDPISLFFVLSCILDAWEETSEEIIRDALGDRTITS